MSQHTHQQLGQQLGLAALTHEQLTHALRALYQGRIVCPFKRSDLLERGFNPLAERGDVLFGLDERGVRAALISAIAERRRSEELEGRLRVTINRLQDELASARAQLEERT